MKSLIFLLVVAALGKDLALTKDYIEKLRSTVSWEVVDYEDSIFKDWTIDEIKAMLSKKDNRVPSGAIPVTPSNAHPSSVSWTGSNCTHGVVTQGECKADWAIAAATLLSDICCLSIGERGFLSPQELINCDRGNDGCKGGSAGDALFYIKHNGLVNTTCLDYKAKAEKCPRICDNKQGWYVSHHCQCATILDCTGLNSTKNCLTKSPVVGKMQVHRDFTGYKTGVYCWDGKSEPLGVQEVRCTGYTSNPDVITCFNSWGTQWGEKGTFRVYMNDSCGFDPDDGVFSVTDCDEP